MNRIYEMGNARRCTRDQAVPMLWLRRPRRRSFPRRLASRTCGEGAAATNPPPQVISESKIPRGVLFFFGMSALCALLFPAIALGIGAGATAERKQQELEAAVVASASAVKADLTKLQCGNLVYASNKSSVCFADKFLTDVAQETHLDVGRNFVAVRLDAETLFDFPFCVWSGEDTFSLTAKDRENLRKYLLNGGFILSSPGCSDPRWDAALRKELKLIFPEQQLTKIPMSHPVFSTVFKIPRLTDKQGKAAQIEGLEINGRLVMIYSKDGLNDVGNAKGCCCCGGNMITESAQVNVNAFTYALLY